MKYLSLLAIVSCAFVAACSYTERTVVERPVAQAPIVYETPSRTVYVTPYYP